MKPAASGAFSAELGRVRESAGSRVVFSAPSIGERARIINSSRNTRNRIMTSFFGPRVRTRSGAGTARPRDFSFPDERGDGPSPPLAHFEYDMFSARLVR